MKSDQLAIRVVWWIWWGVIMWIFAGPLVVISTIPIGLIAYPFASDINFTTLAQISAGLWTIIIIWLSCRLWNVT